MPELRDWSVGEACCYVGGLPPPPGCQLSVFWQVPSRWLCCGLEPWFGATCAGRLGSRRHTFLSHRLLSVGRGAAGQLVNRVSVVSEEVYWLGYATVMPFEQLLGVRWPCLLS